MSKEWFKAHGPEIAIGASFIGLASAGVWGCMATAKAIRKLDSTEVMLGRKLTFKERFKLMLPYYIGPVGLTVSSAVGVGFGLHGEVVRTNSLISATKTLGEAAIAKDDAIKEVVGEKKAKEIEEEAAKKLFETKAEDEVRALDEAIDLGTGITYFCDPYILGEMVIIGDIQDIRSRWNDIGAKLTRDATGSISAYDAAKYVYRDKVPVPKFLEDLEWSVLDNGIPDVSIAPDSEADLQGRIMHYIVHNNKPQPISKW